MADLIQLLGTLTVCSLAFVAGPALWRVSRYVRLGITGRLAWTLRDQTAYEVWADAEGSEW